MFSQISMDYKLTAEMDKWRVLIVEHCVVAERGSSCLYIYLKGLGYLPWCESTLGHVINDVRYRIWRNGPQQIHS